MPRNTRRTIENCKTHPDGLECPSCESTETKFSFFNNKKKAQPRYRCLKCKKAWTQGGKTRGPYNKRGSNPGVAAHATTSEPPSMTAVVHRRRSPRLAALRAWETGRGLARVE